MLALEYILVVPLACQLQSRRDESRMSFGISPQLSIFTQQHPERSGRADVTQNISTADARSLVAILGGHHQIIITRQLI